MCLRLAIIACHARGEVEPGALAFRRSGGVATLSLPAAWADTHPRTLHLLTEEATAWERGGPLLLELKS